VDLSTGEPDSGRNDCDTAAGFDQRDQRLRVACLEDDPRVYVSDAAGAVEHLTGAEPLPQQQDALVPEVGDIDCRSPRQMMQWGYRGEDTDREQQTPFEVIVAAPDRQGEMDLAALDEPQGVDTALFDEMDVNSWSRLQIPCEKWRQHALNHLGRGCDAKAPDFAAPYGLCMFGELVNASEQCAAPGQEAFASACHTNSASRTLKEPDTQLHLKVADLSPQRRLGDAQPGGGSGEGARLGDRDEVAEVTELHLVYCLEGIDYRSHNALDSAPAPSLSSCLKEDRHAEP
jgi:hypothetical protein